jgi:uncharacterized membrane protein YphA (DoxX/SURF4 family)
MSGAIITSRLQLIVRIALAAVFLYAAAMKAIRVDTGSLPSTMFSEWARSHLLRDLIIAGEIFMAAWLLMGVELHLASVLAIGVVSVFSGLVIFEIEAQHPKPCGCTGVAIVAQNPQAIRSSLRFDLARNALMICGAGCLYVSAKSRSGTIFFGMARFPMLRTRRMNGLLTA